jgi:capsular polysaccharide biosynthesis protein
MNIISFVTNNFREIKKKDENLRNIGYSLFKNIQITGRNNYYPNILLYENKDSIINSLFSPYDEKVMSLNKDSFYDNNIYIGDIENIKITEIITEKVFFFIYNFDNYYHYIYDTLPYLYTYLELKKIDSTIKLLINYPNKNKTEFYKFNEEFLYKIVAKDDIIIHNESNIYSSLYVSTSLTHGGVSNSPPRKEIFEIYDIIKKNINYDNIRDIYKKEFAYKKLYISRRTWLNDDKSNIGTDYTSRRKMMNEDDLVLQLNKKGFKEIFVENLTTDEKIYLFANASEIIGAIGGGMANLLFSPSSTKSYVIVSPFFLDINYRFKYSIENTQIQYFNETKVFTENNSIENNKQEIPLYCRVQITDPDNMFYNKIGEIIEYCIGDDNNYTNKYKVALSNNDVAGFNNNHLFLNIIFNKDEFKLLDNGLNSPYIFEYNNLLLSI